MLEQRSGCLSQLCLKLQPFKVGPPVYFDWPPLCKGDADNTRTTWYKVDIVINKCELALFKNLGGYCRG